ncbi:alpha/beta fold hydrolase [Allosphingosinicella deserti]|uniref:Alpha/beta hydrolase n=1 Tax=Allosphingosinicella deserti TaxID=2116704 RepID=A0A2P7QIL2_9SPHN|nr:alpha/beta hydrolase [Sphingomonas deserti]PSJ37766.1 alpha/beta hydrolase [Sphingomonas deserti]
MTNAQIRGHGRTPTSKPSAGALWKWGAGAAGAALAAGTAAYNMARTRRADDANPPLGSFIEVDGVRLHYVEQGSGPLIVLLHGNGMMVQDWQASGVFDALARTNRVLAFDRPGFGWSERPRSVIWTPAAQARLIAAALSQRGDRDATIVGHSFGTLVALELGLNHPGTARSLVLISGYYHPSVRADVAFAAPPAIPVLGDAIRYTVSPLLGAAMRRGMETQMFAPGAVTQGWKTDFPFEMTLRPSQIRAAAADAALMIPAAASFASRLGSLDLPVSLIAGDGDKIVSTADQSVRLARELGPAELLIVEGAGHMVHHTAPAEVVAAILAASTRTP